MSEAGRLWRGETSYGARRGEAIANALVWADAATETKMQVEAGRSGRLPEAQQAGGTTRLAEEIALATMWASIAGAMRP